MRMEFIIWEDAATLDDRWIEVDDVEDWEHGQCFTVGFVIREDDVSIFLAQTYSEENGGTPKQVGHVWIIPKSGILGRWQLELTHGLQKEGSVQSPREGGQVEEVHSARSEDPKHDDEGWFRHRSGAPGEIRSAGYGSAERDKTAVRDRASVYEPSRSVPQGGDGVPEAGRSAWGAEP